MSTKSLIYQIKFYSYWHTSSGLSSGTEASLSVMKDENDLPFIPGKTLKGLLREAATQINSVNNNLVSIEFIEKVFGIGDDEVEKRKEENSADESESHPGQCYFANAKLSSQLTKQFAKPKEEESSKYKTQLLYDTVTSTAISKNGQAKDHSLRSMQVTVPLTLYGRVIDFPDNSKDQQQMEYCFQWIKRMGVNRNRGLGRCEFSTYQN